MDRLLFKSYEDLVSDIKEHISKINRYDFDLVVGIPRSGMIPAYLISAFLNIDCCDVDTLIENRPLQRGITRTTKGNLKFPKEANRILLIDDSIYSGDSLAKILSKIPENLKQTITTGVVYATGKGKEKVDFYLLGLEGMKLFEWGIYHNNIAGRTCFDMDGVLCKDCRPEQNDDGEKYLEFITNAEPLFIPTNTIFAIVTNRLEKYRPETVAWLEKHKVRYEHLIMLDLPNKAERQKIDGGIEHKGKFYKQFHNTVLFIESSFNQSVSIAKVSGKPVYCVDRNKFITPELSSVLLNNSHGFLKSKYYSLKHRIKMLLIKS